MYTEAQKKADRKYKDKTYDQLAIRIKKGKKIHADFTNYIEKAKKRYNVMKLIGGEEVDEDNLVTCVEKHLRILQRDIE